MREPDIDEVLEFARSGALFGGSMQSAGARLLTCGWDGPEYPGGTFVAFSPSKT